MEREYYVYLVVREDTDEIFHVGKGCKSGERDRMYDYTNNRNELFKEIVAKHPVHSVMLKGKLSEDDAYALEREIITLLRAQGLAYTNFHEGGRGGDTFKYDGEERKLAMIDKCRKASLGSNNPMYQKDWREGKSEEEVQAHHQQISETLKARYKEDDELRELIGKKSRESWKKEGRVEQHALQHSKRVYKYDLEMNFIESYMNQNEAAKSVGMVGVVTLRKNIKLGIPWKGFYWRREEVEGVTTIEQD